jgi:Cys-tRNA(Pro)/Cys-tRNA(Cys) deacylase
VLKTLVTEVDGKAVCVIVPPEREVSIKRLAAAFGGKSARRMRPAEAEWMTGYKIGGISPFGQRRKVPTVVEAAVLAEALGYVNGGQRRLQLRLDSKDIQRAIGAVAAYVAA